MKSRDIGMIAKNKEDYIPFWLMLQSIDTWIRMAMRKIKPLNLDSLIALNSL